MSNQPAPAPHHPAESKWRILALVLLPIVGILLVLLAIFLVRPRDAGVVTVVYTDGAPAGTTINTGDVIDATDPRAFIVPQVGYRYKVFISDESEDRASGVARLGGRVTFIPNGRRGQTAVVDLTRIGERVYEAVLVKVLSEVEMPPKAPPAPFAPRPGDPTAGIIAGAELDVVISEASSKNPETEGVAKVHGLVIFVNGVTQIGERVNVRIVERRERLAFAEPTGKPAGPAPEPVRRTSFQPRPGDRVIPGAEMDVVITEASAKNPDTEGVARVNGLVVFVQGATTIGERVNVRIVERGERAAVAELTGKPAAPAPVRRSFFQPSPGDPVVPGAIMDVVITEPSGRNPDTEGVARVNGLVVFVQGATTIGERLNVRIVERGGRAAVAEPTGTPPGDVIRRAFIPSADDPAAAVIAGAEMDVVITERSTKNPETEGVAKVNGLVVFVNGATTVGERVNVRITARRERMAFAELTGKPAAPAPAPAPAPETAPAPAPEVAPAPAPEAAPASEAVPAPEAAPEASPPPPAEE